MTVKMQEDIRARAYAIWELEGRPEGRSQQHWDQACVEIAGDADIAGPKRSTRKPRAAVAAGGEKPATRSRTRAPVPKDSAPRKRGAKTIN